MPANQVDLVKLFQSVTQALQQSQASLDEADEINQNHGTNMVQTFQTVTRTVQQQKKKGASDSASLAAAARQLAKTSTSGSGQQYARNLSAAAAQFKGRKIDQRGAMDLLMTLIGGGAAAGQTGSQASQTAGGDVMSMLLGGLTSGASSQQESGGSGADLLSSLLGGGAAQNQPPAAGGGDLLSALLGGGAAQTQQPSSVGGDLLSTLLGGVLGGGTTQTAQSSQGDGQIGLDDILQAGMAFLQAKQQGQSNAQALLQAFMAASRMGDTVHRQQSTELVVNSFLQALSSAGGK